jgi:hypothetical protein
LTSLQLLYSWSAMFEDEEHQARALHGLAEPVVASSVVPKKAKGRS